MEYPSRLIEEAVTQISRLPGIGKKSAIRLALHLLKRPKEEVNQLTEAIERLRTDTRYCATCHVISDTAACSCKTPHCDASLVCVVEEITDVLAIRNTGQYNGMFHVLGGRISPMDGKGPDQVHIQSLLDRINGEEDDIKEVILALSATMEGDTTAYYITRVLKESGVKISTIARGIPVGSELEFTDEITLGRSIVSRTRMKS